MKVLMKTFAVFMLPVVSLLVVSWDVNAQQAMDIVVEPEDVRIGIKEYSPYLDRGFPQRVFWGDTHVHTSYSTDAGMVGCMRDPEDAYRFALGEEVISSIGVRAKIIQPLDFLVVADHAENLGLAPMIQESNPDLLRTNFGRKRAKGDLERRLRRRALLFQPYFL